MEIKTEKIKEIFRNKGYTFFNDKLNIIGIRSENDIANSFDDWLCVIRDKDLKIYPVTTDPGKYWLENPLNVDGTAILVPGQYIDSYKIGLHRGRYEALVQYSALRVWRDNSGDNILDMDGKIYEGMFGINIHRSNPSTQSQIVEKWSAGCQVFKKVSDFNEFMSVCKRSKQKLFTYTLLDENDFN